MEQPHTPHAGERLGRIILGAAFLLAVFAVVAQLRSDFSRSVARGATVSVAVLTAPPVVLVYNSRDGKAELRPVRNETDPSATNAMRAAAALEAAGIRVSGAQRIFYFRPQPELDRQTAWDNLKNWLNGWRSNPGLLPGFFGGYLAARASGNCNIPLFDFIAAALEATRLEVADFMINPSRVSAASAMPDTEPEVRAAPSGPLVLEVLNATGRKGAAALVTRYLRDMSDRGVQRLDVLRFDNYRSTEAKSRILDHSGRIEDIGRLARNMGLPSAEIVAEKRKISTSDATVILGADYLGVLDGWKQKEMLH